MQQDQKFKVFDPVYVNVTTKTRTVASGAAVYEGSKVKGIVIGYATTEHCHTSIKVRVTECSARLNAGDIIITDISQLEFREGALAKGESINYLGYEILNCTNNDGLVLLGPCGQDIKRHLGNFGPGDEASVLSAKKYALIHYMLNQPELFAGTLANKIATYGSGTMHEYSLLEGALRADGLEMPEEITATTDGNRMILFNGEKLTHIRP